MAKLRIPRKPLSFVYEGVEFHLRRPTTMEQAEITRIGAEYQRSIRKEVVADKKDGILEDTLQMGDIKLLNEAQRYIALHLCVDPETGERIFTDKQEEADSNNPDSRELVSLAPADFITAIWNCHTGQDDKKQYLAIELVDVFGEEFVQKNATIGSNVVKQELRRLDGVDKAKAHAARVALDIKDKPGGESPDADPQKPTTALTTT